MLLLPQVPSTPPYLLVRGYLLEDQRPFLQAMNSSYKAGLINLCCSGLCCWEEGKWAPCLVKNALHDPSSTVQLRWKYDIKHLLWQAASWQRRRVTWGKYCWSMHSKCNTLGPNFIHRETWSAPDSCTGASILFWVGVCLFVCFVIFPPKIRTKKGRKKEIRKSIKKIKIPYLKKRQFLFTFKEEKGDFMLKLDIPDFKGKNSHVYVIWMCNEAGCFMI